MPDTIISGASSSGSSVPCDQSEDKCKDVGDKPGMVMVFIIGNDLQKKSILSMPKKYIYNFANGWVR